LSAGAGAPSTPTRRWLRRLLWGLALALVALLGFAAFLLLYNIGHEEVPGSGDPLAPEDQAFLRTLQPRLSWPDDGSYRWRVEVLERGGGVAWETSVSDNAAEIPEGVLRPGEGYRWIVSPLDRLGRVRTEPLVRRDFRVAPRLEAGELRVFPGDLLMSREDWHLPHELHVTCPGGGWVALGNGLVLEQGEKGLEVQGERRLRVWFDWRLAPQDPAEWGAAEITCRGARIEVPVRLDPGLAATLESWSDSGMDVVLDTPSFSNFEAGVLTRLTGGTCTGIVLVVKFFFEQARFGAEAAGDEISKLEPITALSALLDHRTLAVRQAWDFRHWSQVRPQELQDLMSLAHSDNINPLHLPGLLGSLVGLSGAPEIIGELAEEMEGGQVPLLARYHIRRNRISLFGGSGSFLGFNRGHVLLAVRLWRFRDLAVVLAYDPNHTYEPGASCVTVLHIPTVGDPVLFEDGRPEKGRFRYLVMTGGRSTVLLSAALQGLQERWRDLLETGRDLKVVPR